MGFIGEEGFPSLLRLEPRERARAIVLAVGPAHETARWLARRLRAIGYEVESVRSVEESKSTIEEALISALAASDLVAVVGGIKPGSAPTFEAVASVLGRPLVEDEEAKRMVEEYYHLYASEEGCSPPPGYHAFYILPEGSIVIRNQKGPAPGIFLEESGKYLLCVPENPTEVAVIMEEEAEQYVRELLGIRYSASVHILTKSWDEERLQGIAEGVSDTAPWVFAQVKRNVFSREGWGLTITVFARTPSELSERLAKAVELAEAELRRRGVDFLEKSIGSELL